MTVYEFAVVVCGGITAIATSVAAFLSWRAYSGRVRIEYFLKWTRDTSGQVTGELRITVRNGCKSSFQVGSVEVAYPPMTQLDKKDKHESWGINRAPLWTLDPIPPGGEHSFKLVYLPDWSAWAEHLKSRSLRFRLGKLLRRKHISAYSIIRLYAKDVASISVLKRHTQKVMVSADMVIKQAEASNNQV